VRNRIGVENLIPSPSLDGGGLHQTTTGGFLNGRDLKLRNADIPRCIEKIAANTNSDQSAGKVLAFWDRYFQRRRGGP
jgi:hypothetical protein